MSLEEKAGNRAGHDRAVAVHERLLLREAAITLLDNRDLTNLISRKEKKTGEKKKTRCCKNFLCVSQSWRRLSGRL